MVNNHGFRPADLYCVEKNCHRCTTRVCDNPWFSTAIHMFGAFSEYEIGRKLKNRLKRTLWQAPVNFQVTDERRKR